jgi:hypothetical protein
MAGNTCWLPWASGCIRSYCIETASGCGTGGRAVALIEHDEAVCRDVLANGLRCVGPDDSEFVRHVGLAKPEVQVRQVLAVEVAVGLAEAQLGLGTVTVADVGREVDPGAQSPATVPYALVGGAVIADDWDDLVDGKLKTPILLTETGNGPPESPFICQGSEVWSNTKVDGTVSAGGSCTNWTVTTGTGDASRSTTSGAFWTESECPNINCGIALPFYCFQQ